MNLVKHSNASSLAHNQISPQRYLESEVYSWCIIYIKMLFTVAALLTVIRAGVAPTDPCLTLTLPVQLCPTGFDLTIEANATDTFIVEVSHELNTCTPQHHAPLFNDVSTSYTWLTRVHIHIPSTFAVIFTGNTTIQYMVSLICTDNTTVPTETGQNDDAALQVDPPAPVWLWMAAVNISMIAVLMAAYAWCKRKPFRRLDEAVELQA